MHIYLKEIQKKTHSKQLQDGYDGSYGGKFLGVESASLLANLKAGRPGLSSKVQQVAPHIFLDFYLIVQFSIFGISADCRAS